MAEDRKVTPEDFEAAGYEIGLMAAAFIRGALRGLADYEPPAEIPAEPQEEERVKTRLSDCRACWCNTCSHLEECDMIRANLEPDGLRPNPCVGCFNGMRLMPCEAEPACGEYEKAEYENNG